MLKGMPAIRANGNRPETNLKVFGNSDYNLQKRNEISRACAPIAYSPCKGDCAGQPCVGPRIMTASDRLMRGPFRRRRDQTSHLLASLLYPYGAVPGLTCKSVSMPIAHFLNQSWGAVMKKIKVVTPKCVVLRFPRAFVAEPQHLPDPENGFACAYSHGVGADGEELGLAWIWLNHNGDPRDDGETFDTFEAAEIVGQTFAISRYLVWQS